MAAKLDPLLNTIRTDDADGLGTDAPSDGKQYARKDGAWAEAVSGGGNSAPIAVTSGTRNVVAADNGKLFTNAGATGNIVLSLDTVANLGNTFEVGVINEAKDGYGIDSKTELCLHLNNDVVDSSKNSATVTNNNVTFSNSAGEFKFGYAAYLNGSDASLSIPHLSAFNFGASTNKWTIQCWYKPVGGSGDRNILAHYKTTSTYDGWVLWHGSDGKVHFANYPANNNFVSATTLSNGTWYHIAVINDGTYTKLYVNGSAESSISSFNITSYTTPIDIGSNSQGSWLNGYIDEVKIDNGTAQWTGNFTPPDTEFYPGHSITVTPNAADQLPGTAAAGNSIQSGAKGDYIKLRAMDSDWICTGVYPASANWADLLD